MKKFFDKLTEWLPIVWGILLTLIITFGGLAILFAVFRFMLLCLGVI